MNTVKDRIRSLLEEDRVKPRSVNKVLAGICGISSEGVRLWWNTTTSISTKNLTAIAEHFDVNLEWLVNGNGPKSKSGLYGVLPGDSQHIGVNEPGAEYAVDNVIRLSREEHELLASFRSLRKSGQMAVLSKAYEELEKKRDE